MGNQGKQRADQVNQYRREVLRQLIAVNHKLNLLAENAGLSDKLAALTEQLRGPTDALQAAVDANQPKEGEQTNGKSTAI